MKRLSLVQQFAVRSAFFVIVMALALGIALTFAVRSLFEREAARTARITATAIVLEHLEGVDLSDGALPAPVRRSIDEMVSRDLAESGITTVKIWNPRGTLLYASDGSEVGRSFADHPALKAALAGKVAVESSEDEDEENAEQFARDGRAIEVYAPLLRAGSSTPAGVFEIYQSYATVERAANELIAIMWGIILLGSIPAYVLQLRLVKQTADELTAARDDVVEIDQRLGSLMEDMELHSLGTLQALVATVDAKDSYTARHSISVANYATAIASRLGYDQAELADIERAALLHDVGKIGTPEAILLKPAKLDAAEFAVMSEHSEAGGHIIESVPSLAHLMPVIRGHHERWDGSGYPDGLVGEDVPQAARILAVADAFDAMTSARPYREPISVDAARAELLSCSGRQFDPGAVVALLDALDHGEVRVTTDHDTRARWRRSS